MSKAWRRANTKKRGGGLSLSSLDNELEQHYQNIASSDLSAERLFERQWALALLERVLTRLQQEYAACGKAEFFEATKVFLTGEKAVALYGPLALKLGTTEAALKMAVSRLRRRYGEIVRMEVAETVTSAAEVEPELRFLIAAFAS